MILRWLSTLLQLCSFVFLQWVNHGASLDLNNPGKSSSSLSHFHSQKEVEGLYQNISNFASSNSLNIINLNKEDPIPITGNRGSNQNQNNNVEQTQGNNRSQNVAYFRIPVSFEITGNYLGYLKFRRALAQSNKVINFDREKISVVKDAGINSVGTISIVGLPDEYKK